MARSEQTDRQTVRIFWQATLRYKRLCLRSLLFPLGNLLQTVVAPLFIGKTLGALAQPHGKPTHYLFYFATAALFGVVCNRLGHPAVVELNATVTGDMQSFAFSTLLKRSVGFHNDNIGGKLVSDALDFAQSYGKLMDSTITGVLQLGVTLVCGSAIIYTESWTLGLFITSMTVLIVGLGIFDSRRMAPRRSARLKANKAVTGHLADTITNVQTVKTFGGENREYARHEKLNARLTEIRIDDWHLMSTRGNNRIALLVLLQIAFVAITIRLVHHNPALLGIGIFAFTFTVTLSNRLFEVNMLLRNLEDGLLQAAPMTEIMQETPEILDAPHATRLKVTQGQVDFNDVTFAYSDSKSGQNVFSNLSLNVAPGEKIGLVGPSGGGKSTLTRLLLRFEDINGGGIFIDGKNVAEVTQKSLREAISYVPQEPLLFHRSVFENIAYGEPDATLAHVKKAARMAHADEFIEQLDAGYETVVGERGVKLSGGQRQRIAIARAILKNAPILVLDEATSALDSESEVLIQDALWRLMEGRTTLVIAHRLSTIQHMDRIIVLEHGKITEHGSHKALLKHGRTYAKLWKHQSGGFIEE